MKMFTVTGAMKDSGESKSMFVKDHSEALAVAKANRKGLMVERIERVPYDKGWNPPLILVAWVARIVAVVEVGIGCTHADDSGILQAVWSAAGSDFVLRLFHPYRNGGPHQ